MCPPSPNPPTLVSMHNPGLSRSKGPWKMKGSWSRRKGTRQGKQAAPSLLQESHTNSCKTDPATITSSLPRSTPFQILSFYMMFAFLGSFSLQPLHPTLCTAQFRCYILCQAGALSCCSAVFSCSPASFLWYAESSLFPTVKVVLIQWPAINWPSVGCL